MRIVYPHGAVRLLVGELPDSQFVIYTDDGAAYSFRKLARSMGEITSTAECKVASPVRRSWMPPEEEYVAGFIHYTYHHVSRRALPNFLTFTFGGNTTLNPHVMIAWEIPFDVVRMAFDDDQLDVILSSKGLP